MHLGQLWVRTVLVKIMASQCLLGCLSAGDDGNQGRKKGGSRDRTQSLSAAYADSGAPSRHAVPQQQPAGMNLATMMNVIQPGPHQPVLFWRHMDWTEIGQSSHVLQQRIYNVAASLVRFTLPQPFSYLHRVAGGMSPALGLRGGGGGGGGGGLSAMIEPGPANGRGHRATLQEALSFKPLQHERCLDAIAVMCIQLHIHSWPKQAQHSSAGAERCHKSCAIDWYKPD